MQRAIAFVTYETPYTPCGGIAAVMRFLPSHVRTASGREVVVLSPYHHNVYRGNPDDLTQVGAITVLFDSQMVEVALLRQTADPLFVFLKPKNGLFFAGNRHPYDLQPNQQEQQPLLRDALFFGNAACLALSYLDPEASWTLLAQDWEGAATAFGVASAGSGWPVYLTLHNSYDSGGLFDAMLLRAGIDPHTCPGQTGKKTATVLERALLLVRPQVFTVSAQFARDLIDDPFQAEVMAPHLRETLRPRIIGIDNGLFTTQAVPSDIMARVEQGDSQPLLDWKKEKRDKVRASLAAMQKNSGESFWGNPGAFVDDNLPWFFMAGRDDARQKGYDVAAAAAESFLRQGGKARFIFCPMPGDEGLAGLGFLKKLTQRYPAHVLVIPAYWRDGYQAALQGATFGIMPSLYEPFGMASEYYQNGTPCIGRATGGLIQQIVPLRSAVACSRAVEDCVRPWHAWSALSTGILFREKTESTRRLSDWTAINAAGYRNAPDGDRLSERMAYPLFQEMAGELCKALFDAGQLYHGDPGRYGSMVANGLQHIRAQFSWERCAGEYCRLMTGGSKESTKIFNSKHGGHNEG